MFLCSILSYFIYVIYGCWFQLIHNPEGFMTKQCLFLTNQGWDGTLQRMYSFGEGEQPDAKHVGFGVTLWCQILRFLTYFDIF